MTETVQTTDANGGNAVSLPAGSFDSATLDRELTKALNLKTEKGQDNAVQRAIENSISDKDEYLARQLVIPEGHIVQEVTAADGTTVKAAVMPPAKEGEGAADEEAKPDDLPPAPAAPGKVTRSRGASNDNSATAAD